MRPPGEAPYPPAAADRVELTNTRPEVGTPWENNSNRGGPGHSVRTRCSSLDHCCTSHIHASRTPSARAVRTAAQAARHREATTRHRWRREAAGGTGLASGQSRRRAGPTNRRHTRRSTRHPQVALGRRGTANSNERSAAPTEPPPARWWIKFVLDINLSEGIVFGPSIDPDGRLNKSYSRESVPIFRWFWLHAKDPPRRKAYVCLDPPSAVNRSSSTIEMEWASTVAWATPSVHGGWNGPVHPLQER